IKKIDAWDSIAKTLNVYAKEIESKIHTLRSQFTRERKKFKSSKKTGSGSEDLFSSKWFAYEPLLFLIKGETTTGNNDTMENHESLHRSDLENTADQNVFTPPVLPNECTPKSAKQTRRDDNVLSVVMGILKTTATKLDNSIGIPDTTKSFASFIGAKMTSYSPQTRTLEEHAIFEIITKADRGYYESWRHQNNHAYGSNQDDYLSRARQNSGPYGYTTARNEDTTDYPTIQPPLSVSSQESYTSSMDDFNDLM
ncbi:uncharacterized protein LOC125058738, partial [Pieris napi]|uniref:uncharacterized protein LOC125058738 n=1 Tax=Pieris napi TaxID=78633 RepID=UPI001FB9FE9B